MTAKIESNFGREIVNCVECFKPIYFENSDGFSEEYEVHEETSDKYCFSCASKDKRFFGIFCEDEEYIKYNDRKN